MTSIGKQNDTKTHRMYKHDVCVWECGITRTLCRNRARAHAFYVVSLITIDDIDGKFRFVINVVIVQTVRFVQMLFDRVIFN